jgi:hypothetical protein
VAHFTFSNAILNSAPLQINRTTELPAQIIADTTDITQKLAHRIVPDAIGLVLVWSIKFSIERQPNCVALSQQRDISF